MLWVSELELETVCIQRKRNQTKNMLFGKSVANFSGTFVPWSNDAILWPIVGHVVIAIPFGFSDKHQIITHESSRPILATMLWRTSCVGIANFCGHGRVMAFALLHCNMRAQRS